MGYASIKITLDVPPLPLGIDGVEGQRRLARPAQSRDHDEPVARDRHIDVLTVVLPRPFNDDRVVHRGGIIASNPDP